MYVHRQPARVPVRLEENIYYLCLVDGNLAFSNRECNTEEVQDEDNLAISLTSSIFIYQVQGCCT